MPLTPTNDQIDDQLQLLAVGRHTLSIYLRQMLSRGGLAYTPASTIAGIEQICRRFRVPLGAAAVQFPLACPQVVAVIPGARSPAEVLRFTEFWRLTIPAEFWETLRHQGLIDAAASLPMDVPGGGAA